MNRFAWMAEELTWMEESLDDPRYEGLARPLKRALQRAFVEACKAAREVRVADEGAAVKVRAAVQTSRTRNTPRRTRDR